MPTTSALLEAEPLPVDVEEATDADDEGAQQDADDDACRGIWARVVSALVEL